ncbi:nicotinate-nucleotide adenylyltransferase [Maricaulis maris]|uniref:Probable nicotinate-nucleotide adenylyltransferase n=1 Tax=Maricaulis maris TaxID=74318 RepID=A0A495D558_9PROT|nr:nicotinate-nucleotide adenylyltransferase [Maricaulis maris]RKQ96559.1 nicotinate-nucleotide adenylyltransferase [Maricaulis maris]
MSRAGALRGDGLARGMRIGLFGGSFDPPHAGHLHVARTALRRLGLNQVWWLVSPQNPLKISPSGDFQRRFNAVRTLATQPGMHITDIESRLGTTRTIDLLTHLKTRHPGVHFVWLMGADNLAGIHRWAHWPQIFRSVPVAVIARPQDAVRARLSRAATQFATSRIRESEAAALPLQSAPAWTYLTERLHSHSSTALRARH